MEHSKLPWKLRTKEGNAGFQVDAENQPIADIRYIKGEGSSNKGIQTEKANARFIVRACNSHDDLLAALLGDDENCIPNAQTILSQVLLGNYEAAKTMLREMCLIHAAAIAKAKP